MNTRQSMLALVLAGCLVAPVAADDKAFTVALTEEFLSAVVTGAVHGTQFESVTLSLDGGNQVTVDIRTNFDTLRGLAKSDVHSLVGKLESYLTQGGPGDYINVKLKGRLSPLSADASGGTPSDAVLAVDFDTKDLAVELHKGAVTLGCAGIETLALWLLDKYASHVKVSDSVEISAQVHWFWQHWILSSSGHRLVARFAFARYPVVPFTLDAGGISTADHVLRVSGHRQ